MNLFGSKSPQPPPAPIKPGTLHDDDIEHAIAEEQFHTFPRSCLTVCCLTLLNGFAVAGFAVCQDPVTFDAAEGRKHARIHAKARVTELEVYRMKDRPVERRAGIRYSPSEMSPLNTELGGLNGSD